MLYMNDYDMDRAVSRFIRSSKPNRLALALVVRNLAEWANNNSDGWAYWPKPCNAAKAAMEHIQSTTYAANELQESQDITDAEVIAALRPIKAFLTRQGVSRETRECILRAAL
jgi:hypothetical protein